jgi:hypothetical protein
MELTWWLVAIGGCVALAACIVAVLRPVGGDRRLRLLANVDRLTRLPEYRRALRLRVLSTAIAVALLCVAFVATVIAAARPTGLPSAAQRVAAAQPEDIMVCLGGPPSDRTVAAALRYFAGEAKTFTTERIGLSSANRRLIPLTRDYQYAAGRFGGLAAAPDALQRVAYVDYAGDVADVLAMCLTGFPAFDQPATQRRSIVYVGPASLRTPGDTRPVLFTVDAVRDLAQRAGVQINAVTTGPTGAAVEALARDTGGQTFGGGANAATHLSDIRKRPPTAAEGATATVAAVETPDVPVVLALLAVIALLLWPLAVRR